MWLFGKRDPIRKQNWSTICFDPGCSTSSNGVEIDHYVEYHHVEYRLCRITGERDVLTNTAQSQSIKEMAARHPSLVKAKHLWVERGELLVSKDAIVYDDDWECVVKPTDNSMGKWEYKPLTTVEQHLRNLERCAEFCELIAEHQLVADAYGEFETAVKLHSGLDKTK